MPNLFHYLPELTIFIAAWLLLDLLGSGLFRLLVRPRARQNWKLANRLNGIQDNGVSQKSRLWSGFLHRVGYKAGEDTAQVRMKMKGVLRNKANGQWHPAEGRIFFTISPLSMVWYADITRAFMVSVKATEQYAATRAFSTRWIFSAFPFCWLITPATEPIGLRNAFWGLAGALWQPHWWSHYVLHLEKEEGDCLWIQLSHQGLSMCVKAQMSAEQELKTLSLWSENWTAWQAELQFDDYRSVQEQKMPFRVDVLQKNAKGEVFVQAEMEVTDVVQGGAYAWW